MFVYASLVVLLSILKQVNDETDATWPVHVPVNIGVDQVANHVLLCNSISFTFTKIKLLSDLVALLKDRLLPIIWLLRTVQYPPLLQRGKYSVKVHGRVWDTCWKTEFSKPLCISSLPISVLVEAQSHTNCLIEGSNNSLKKLIDLANVNKTLLGNF